MAGYVAKQTHLNPGIHSISEYNGDSQWIMFGRFSSFEVRAQSRDDGSLVGANVPTMNDFYRYLVSALYDLATKGLSSQMQHTRSFLCRAKSYLLDLS